MTIHISIHSDTKTKNKKETEKIKKGKRFLILSV